MEAMNNRVIDYDLLTQLVEAACITCWRSAVHLNVSGRGSRRCKFRSLAVDGCRPVVASGWPATSASLHTIGPGIRIRIRTG